MTNNKRQECEDSGTSASREATVPSDATFKFELHDGETFGKAGQSINGRILVGGNMVGQIEGTLVDRKLIRTNGGPASYLSFHNVCDEVRRHHWVVYHGTRSYSWECVCK